MKFLTQKSAILLLLFLSITELNAQGKVSGKVVDEAGQPTAFATVSLLSPTDSTVVQGKITDEEGSYEIQNVADGSYILRITFVGYEPTFSDPFSVSPDLREVNLGKSVLKEYSQTLDEVTVSTQRALIEKHPDKLVMNLEDNILAKGSMANEILEMAPLVSSGANGELRLMGKANVMILIDGKTIPEASLNTILQNLSAEEIEKVEIITNPPARYDASASGGVINVVTKRGQQLGFKGTYNLIASQGHYGKLYNGFGLNYRTEKITLFGILNYSVGKNLHEQESVRDFQNIDRIVKNSFESSSNYQTPSGRIGVTYLLNKNHEFGIAFDAYISESEMNLDGITNFRGYTTKIDSAVLAKTNATNKHNVYNFSLNYLGKLNEKGDELSFIATHTLYNRNNRQLIESQVFSAEQDPVRGIETIRTSLPSDIDITIAQTDYTHRFNKRINADVGFKYTRVSSASLFSQSGISGSSSLNTGYDENITAGYLSLNALLAEYSIQAGLRGENTSANIIGAGQREFFSLFPGIAVRRNFNDALGVSLSYSRKVDRPLYQNMLPIKNYVDRYTVWEGNPNLRPEFSNVVELSGSFNNLTLIAGYTRKKDPVFEIPVSDEETQILRVSMRNIDFAEAYNLSAILPFNIISWWQTNNSVTGIYNKAKSKSEQIIFSQDQFSFIFNSTNSFSFSNKWKGELSGYYNSTVQNGIIKYYPRYALRAGVGRDILAGKGNLKLLIEDILWSEWYNGEGTVGSVYQAFENRRDTRRIRIAFFFRFGKQTVKTVQDKGLGNESEKQRLSY